MFLRTINNFGQQLYRLISSNKFLLVVFFLFTLSAAWVAMASLYPMAFDEDFHVGVIKIYAQHLLPFGLQPTPDMAQFGGVVADPSYLFHYLMSFPWRLLHDVFHWSEIASIIGLRFINIGFFVGGLVVFWHVLRLSRLSRFASNLIIAFCCLIPISPLLAGQVNYDTLLILGTAACFYFAVRILQSLQNKHQLPVTDSWWLLIILLLSAATKYAFLPIAVAIGAIVVVAIVLPKSRWKVLYKFVKKTLALGLATKLLLAFLVIISLGLNYRYVDNLVNYHAVAPKCDKFFSVDACRAYGPYGRTYLLKDQLASDFQPKHALAYFVEDWIPGMTFRLFFSVAGPTNDFDTRQPVFSPVVIYSAGVGLAIVLFILHGKRILRDNPAGWLFIGTIAVYVLSLVVQVYGGYKISGEPVAVNGRYLLPLAPIIGALCVMAFRGLKQKSKSRSLAVIIVSAALIVIVLQGGGIGTYIVRAKPAWFFPGWGQNSYQAAHDILEPVTLKVF